MTDPIFPRLDAPDETNPENESDSDVLTVPRLDGPDNDQNQFRVILYDDDHHSQQAVVEQLVKATECSTQKALRIMLEAHHKGRAVCFRGSKSKAERVVKVLREIRLQCEMDGDE